VKFRGTSKALICRIISLALIALYLPMGAVGRSKVNKAEQAKAAVTQLENQWLAALNNANANAIAGILADDFVRPAPESGSFVNKTDLVAYYRTHLKPIAPEQRRIDDMSISVYGSAAIARGSVIRTATDGHIVSKLLFTDVFVERDGKWQAVSAQENSVATGASPTH
jgi:ketosteroid isomerase-like protein